jgi:hypothetical protein
MITRGYGPVANSYEAKGVASIIAAEVIRGGRSEGWTGSIKAREKLETILIKFNIGYVDDMLGAWEYVEPNTPDAFERDLTID